MRKYALFTKNCINIAYQQRDCSVLAQAACPNFPFTVFYTFSAYLVCYRRKYFNFRRKKLEKWPSADLGCAV